jgi:hypothetical protein
MEPRVALQRLSGLLAMSDPLVRPLFAGPVDVVADVHGEMDALRALLQHLGYRDGAHPAGRRLVFLGDLTDRGPDSPAVVDLVRRLVDAGLAQCVLGNHELNILLEERKEGNDWYFGLPPDAGLPVRLADGGVRDAVRAFFRRLPLVLERPDLRIVHACWEPAMVERVRGQADALALYHGWRARIDEALDFLAITDEVERERAQQNRNPVKVLTSGLEQRTAVPFHAGGRLRRLERVEWWRDYPADAPLCVFGHYSRARPPGEPLAGPPGRAVSIDHGMTRRQQEREAVGPAGPFQTRLVALRHPELVLVCDDGTTAAAPCR